MTALTTEQRHEIEKAGDEPVRFEDPETHAAYVLLKADVYEQIKPVLGYAKLLTDQVPEGIRRSREAFLRDLPALLARKRLRGRWALYHGDKRLGTWRNAQRMMREIVKLSLREDEIYSGVICPHLEDDDEIDHSFFEFEEGEPNP
jgi:hypothetical protein